MVWVFFMQIKLKVNSENVRSTYLPDVSAGNKRCRAPTGWIYIYLLQFVYLHVYGTHT